MKIGKYKIQNISTGTFKLDGGAMFGIIPKPLWEKSTDADEKNRIKLGASCLLLESESKKIIVDTGIGTDWDDKFNTIYAVENKTYELINSLSMLGISPDSITDVIITHLHFDHIGGAVCWEEDKFSPAFPNAKHWVQEEHYKWANNSSDKDKGSFIKNRFLPLHDEGLLEFVKGNFQFDDELELIVSNGHTIAQQMLKVSDSSNTLLHCADMIPTSAHIPVPYVMGYDIQPLETIKEKKKILTKAVEENWLLFFEHDPVSIAATIASTEKGFTPKEKFAKLP